MTTPRIDAAASW